MNSRTSVSNIVYECLLQQVTPGLEQRVIEILVIHVGQDHRIDRKDLTRLVIYGHGSFAKIKDTDDRKVRLAIASPQTQGYPNLSDSGQGGDRLGKPEEIEGYIAELESRRERLAEKIRALRQSDLKVHWTSPLEPPRQGRLF